MMKDLISRFTPVTLLGGGGITLLIFALVSGQSGYFIIASLSVLGAAVVVLLNALHIINSKISTGLAAFFGIICVVLLYLNIESIREPIEFKKEKDKRYGAVIQRLKDIREAQVAYHDKYNKYTSNFDTLAKFIKEDQIEVVRMDGSVPDTLTEDEALKRGIISRDTTFVPVKNYVFNEEYMASRKKGVKFDPDALRYIPYTDSSEFDMFTNIVVRSSGMEVSVFEVVDTDPFDPEDVLRVGSLQEPTTAGNWSSER